MIGLCLAGLREFRNSKIATKRSLCLVEQEMDHKSSSLSSLESISNSSMINHIKSLQVECLIDACWSLRQFSRTFKHMRRFNNEILNSLESRFVSHEVKLLIEASRERISFAKNAYLISTRIIDPNLRVQSTFNLALSLYENGFFQSAAYYFDQLLSISVSLIKNDRPRSTDFYNDLNPDYHLESAVYLVKSHLMIDYFDLKSSSDEDKYEFKAESLEALLQRVSKSLETIIRYMIKWKVEETNRASFHFNQSNLNALKTDADSKRLRKIFKTACECVVYICFKLNDFNKALVYMDAYDLLVNSSINDLIDFNLVSENIDDVNVNASDLFKFDNFTRNCQLLGNTLIRYKFIFDCRLMYIFIMDSKSANIIHSSCTKLSQILHDIDEHLFDSKLDFFNSQLNMIHNEWVKANLNDFEYRNLPIEKIELEKLRIENRLKDFKLFEHFLKDGVNKSNYFYEYNLESIDLIGLRFSDALTESISCEDMRSLETNLSKQLSVRKSIDEMVEIAREIILKPIESFIESSSSISLLIDSKFVKLFALAYNSNLYKVTFCPDSFIFCSMKLLKSGEKDGIDEKERDLSKKKVLSYPIRSKPVETSAKSIDKLEVTPRYTSNPKLAVSFLNGRTSPNNGPNPVERAKSRLDTSISVLISQTYTGTDAKRSTLEIIPYKQLTRVRKCSVLGCPQIPSGLSKASSFKIDKFLKTGLAQMSKICDILCPQNRPTFGSECTKKQLIDDLESSSLVFLSTLSSNQSDSVLVCAESIESPSSFSDEYKKYCLFDSTDLESIDMHKCALLVLNCYSSLNHKPRLKLAKKLLSRGCKCVLLVISPLSDQLMTQFYCLFFNELKSLRSIVLSYSSAVHKLCEANSELTKLIWSSFCLLSANEKLELDLDELEKSMSQMAIDKTFDQLRKEQNVDYLNPEPRVSILSANFQSCLERTLNQLQILVKFLFNQSISASKDDGGLQFRETLLYLNEIVSKAIAYMAFTKAKPEILDPIAQENFVVMNLLKLLGFTSHRESIYVVRDHKEKFALFYPDNRYMDLCLRTTHIIGSILEMRFGSYMNNNSETSFRVRTVLNQLEALLPIPKPLLNSLVDIISLTRFSPEIILSLTDDSIQTALAYSRNQFDHFYLINKDIYKWSLSDNSEAKRTLDTDMKPLTFKNYINNNNVLNFLLSLGFEVIGNWLHFSNTQFNSILLELALKFLSSFHPDRDMSLYKEMNLNVLGDRSATRSRTNQLSKSADSVKKKQSNDGQQQPDLFDVLVAEPWATEIEERRDMNLKIQVVEKYKQLSAKLSKQRSDAIRNHINYVMKQSVVNKLAITKIDNNADKKPDEQVVDESKSKKTPKVVIKYKPGGGPSKSRTIVNERYKITYEEISKLRAYSHFACQTNVEKINQEAKEKTQKVILPLIKK